MVRFALLFPRARYGPLSVGSFTMKRAIQVFSAPSGNAVASKLTSTAAWVGCAAKPQKTAAASAERRMVSPAADRG